MSGAVGESLSPALGQPRPNHRMLCVRLPAVPSYRFQGKRLGQSPLLAWLPAAPLTTRGRVSLL